MRSPVLLCLALTRGAAADAWRDEFSECLDAKAWRDEFWEAPGWRVYSQGYQDSTLASLFGRLGTTSKACVEFGFKERDTRKVATGRFPNRPPGRFPRAVVRMNPFGANTEYLVQELNWTRAVTFDAAERRAPSSPRDGPHVTEFVTPFNVVDLFRKANVPDDVDYVSIDIDSCDLWVFLALTDVYRPTVVSVEYNSNWALGEYKTNKCMHPGPNGGFFHASSHTRRFYGNSGSLSALVRAAGRRGYVLVWVDYQLDAWFVRDDRVCPGTAPPMSDFEFATSAPVHEQHPPPEVVEQWIIDYH